MGETEAFLTIQIGYAGQLRQTNDAHEAAANLASREPVIEVDAAHPTRATVVLNDTVHRATVQTRHAQAVGDVIRVAVEEADPRRNLLILSEAEPP